MSVTRRARSDRPGDYYCIGCAEVYAEQLKTKDPERFARYKRTARIRSAYGMEPEDFDSLLASQNSCCAICGSDDPAGKYEVWQIDHDHSCCPGKHSCGKCVRGLLCGPCNIGMGAFKDSSEALRRAIKYLKQHKRK